MSPTTTGHIETGAESGAWSVVTRSEMGGTAAESVQGGLALLRANIRYWWSVAPVVRTQLGRWERRARAIEDPVLRELALSKLGEERFNVELAATLATLADRPHRRAAATAIVALQVAYDYLDLLGERLTPEQLAGLRDGGYLHELVETVRLTFTQLPAAAQTGDLLLRAVQRCAQGQTMAHAAGRSGSDSDSGMAELIDWATRAGAGTGLQWQEYLAGATASVLAGHALIGAAGSSRTTRRDAETIDAAYLPICALSMLDSLLDRERDRARGELNYVELYDTPRQMAERLAGVARDAVSATRGLPEAAQHLLTLTGVVAYYASAPAARGAEARPVIRAVTAELGPSIAPTLALMAGWRLAKRLRGRVLAGRSRRRAGSDDGVATGGADGAEAVSATVGARKGTLSGVSSATNSPEVGENDNEA
jgi:hypothetical protein